ncbi:hypothetical protein CCUG62472_00990 [Mycobacteroides salmoniphilum]|nr:hypothetical protein CCUG62472_00990 [Mycobacteroides salmoniphilum]
MMNRLSLVVPWILVAAALILCVPSVLERNWTGIFLHGLCVLGAFYLVWHERRQVRLRRTQEQVAVEWTETRVSEVVAGHDSLVEAVKALREAEPRLGLVTATRIVRNGRSW